ncbi:MAG: FTR1 family iron permease [Candidatus Nitrosotenuis sp.]|nr:MAG: FTR1 family iron permease [Candidatus Nitrosotenuis sp.]
MSSRQILLSVFAMFVVLSSYSHASFGQTTDDSAIQSTGEVVRTGISLVKTSVMNDDYDQASKYSKFTTDFYSEQLDSLRESNVESAADLHLLLLDMHSKIESKSQSGDILENISTAEQYLTKFPKSSRVPFVVSDLLTVADDSYQVAISKNDKEYLAISASLVDDAIQLFNSDSSFDQRQTGELKSFFDDLKSQIAQKHDFVSVGKLITTIQRDLTGTDSATSDQDDIYSQIRQHYDQTLSAVKEGDYATAEEHVIAAYLDNFEYLESDIGKADENLLHRMELNMRENLRTMVQEKKSFEEIQSFINDPILADLDATKSMISKQSHVDQQAIEPKKVTKEMGSATEDQKSGVRSQIDLIRTTLQTALNQYKEGNTQAAFISARTAYLDSYEHVEIPLRTIDPDFTLQVELQFAQLRSLINQKADYEKVEQAAISVKRSLDESERLVTGTGQLAPTIAFTSSFAVIFREGLESVLILGAILTYLEASRNTKFKPFVFYGIIIAIAATAVTWLVASYFITISGASRDLIEAIAALSATAVLFYVSFWILNKIEHKKWMEFVKAKVWQASTTGGTIVFVMLSFFTVYREGFETVLFYEAMFGFAKYMETYVGLGFVAGIASLLGVYFVTRKLGKRLPLKMLFGLTMGVGAYLSIAFLGNAVRELQTLDIISFTSLLGIIPRLDINMAKMTGIYPTLETIIAQIIMLGIYLAAASYVLVLKPKREEKIATMRKSRREIDEFKTN